MHSFTELIDNIRRRIVFPTTIPLWKTSEVLWGPTISQLEAAYPQEMQMISGLSIKKSSYEKITESPG